MTMLLAGDGARLMLGDGARLMLGDGARLMLGDGARLMLGNGATLDDGAANWEAMFVILMDITGVEGVTLTIGVEVDIIGTTVEVGGLKTFPV